MDEAPADSLLAAEESESPNRRRRGWRWTLPALAMSGFFVVVVLGFLRAQHDPAFVAKVRVALQGTAGTFWQRFSSEVVLNPWFYAVFAGVLLLEHLVPAADGQPLLSRGLRQDAVWIFLKTLAHSSLLPIYVLFLQHEYDRHLGFLTIHAVESWPLPARVLLGVLAGDFLFWFTHFVRHKVPSLWYFHAVHHSQRELNFFTEYRVHPIDDLFAFTIGIVPLFMVQNGFTTILAVVWIRHWHTRVYHSNIRTNLGWLRYLIVTPQSHRVHHSILPEHHDRNFGLTFSVWDHLFGTQHRRYDEYPETGINDLDFPCEQDRFELAGLSNLLGQLLYPFRSLARPGY